MALCYNAQEQHNYLKYRQSVWDWRWVSASKWWFIVLMVRYGINLNLTALIIHPSAFYADLGLFVCEYCASSHLLCCCGATVILEHWWPATAEWHTAAAGVHNVQNLTLPQAPRLPLPPRPQFCRSCCHLYCHFPLMAVSTRTQSPFPFWRFAAICTETLIQKVINVWAKGAYASGFWVHYREILWTVNEFQFYGLVINEQPAKLRHDAN